MSSSSADLRRQPTAPAVRTASARAPVLRRCACDAKAGARGECEECRKKRLGVKRAPIAQVRRQPVQPAGGAGSPGTQAAPTPATPTRSGPAPPPCPPIQASLERENLVEAFCLSAASQTQTPECTLTADQNRVLAAATREAASRGERARQRITSGPEGRRFALEMAHRLFTSDPPDATAIVRLLDGVGGFLRGAGPRFAGRACGDTACNLATAYVLGAGQLPIFVCPQAFLEPEKLFQTVIHEVIHLAGIDADPATPEGYCEKFDCLTPCLTRDDADAWSHFIACLGEPIRIRRSFLDRLERSLEDL